MGELIAVLIGLFVAHDIPYLIDKTDGNKIEEWRIYKGDEKSSSLFCI